VTHGSCAFSLSAARGPETRFFFSLLWFYPVDSLSLSLLSFFRRREARRWRWRDGGAWPEAILARGHGGGGVGAPSLLPTQLAAVVPPHRGHRVVTMKHASTPAIGPAGLAMSIQSLLCAPVVDLIPSLHATRRDATQVARPRQGPLHAGMG
jgi:hypothetical protein